MTTSDQDIAIQIKGAYKAYKMYKSPFRQLVDVCLSKKDRLDDENSFHALKNLDLTVRKGERVGLVGRNGSGKTTTLKLITQNFSPTRGKIIVNGSVQALMQTGLGFHPEFTGMQNIKSSLLYNGLSHKELKAAIDDVIDFVELGEFLYQPFKNYSMGMQSRLLFATATAIKPDILIIDEVLGAGDAYFSAKSADRVQRLANSGCTLLLVSHATSQVLQFCEKAVWLEAGEKVMEGEAIEVVKAYEEYTVRLTNEASKQEMQHVQHKSIIQSKWLREKLLKEVFKHQQDDVNNERQQYEAKDEEQALVKEKAEGVETLTQEGISSGGVSRYPSQIEGLMISDVRILNANNEVANFFSTGEAITLEIEVEANKPGEYDCSFTVVIFGEDGRWLLRDCSDIVSLKIKNNLKQTARLEFKHLLLGNGRYTFSAGIYKVLDLNDVSTARYYDLLSRSFEFKVQAPYRDETSVMFHPSCWSVEGETVLSMHEHDMDESINGN